MGQATRHRIRCGRNVLSNTLPFRPLYILMDSQVPLDLVEAAQSGDERDIERLLRVIWPHAYRLAYAIVLDRPLAQDVAQEACINVYRRITALRCPEAFRSWLSRIVVREALKHKKLQTLPLSELSGASYYDDRTASLDLWHALGTLPNGLRAVVVLRYFENLTSREIGAALGVPSPTVRFRLMTALHRLQPLLTRPDCAKASEKKEHYAL